jgi:zinc protease
MLPRTAIAYVTGLVGVSLAAVLGVPLLGVPLLGAIVPSLHAAAMPGLLLAQAPASQEAPTTKGAVLKGKAPVATDVLKVTLPRPVEGDLANGLHLMVLEDHRVPIISFQLQIQGAGGYYDPADLPGLASFTASLMREGTTTKSARQIAQALDTLAASLSVSAGQPAQSATLGGQCLAEHFDEVLGLASDVLLHPAFAPEELDRLKVQRRAQLVQQRANPNFLAQEMFAKVTYGTHPAGRVTATAAFVDAVTRDQLVAFHREHYAPDFAVLAIAGDITFADAKQKIDTALAAWKKSGAATPAVTDPAELSKAGVYLVDRPNSVQTNFIVGTQAITRTSPDFDAVQVMNKVIGGGPTGRLFLNLREDKGFTYGAYSSVQASKYRGTWAASTQVRTPVTGPALKELMGEIDRLRNDAVPTAELDSAKRALVANYALSLESADRVLDYAITSWLYHLPADYWDRRPEALLAVTAEQVQAAARRYLAPARLQIVAVGTGATIGSILESYGALNTYDVDGKAAAYLSDSGK